ncbi:MAG: RNA polymerase sigma factor [Saprospiraceae bacterium]|nr:RNA polymerase sigma factor [Saprospiraceae bacterium]MCB9319059.1 RNA polymerase sigma factor [Lewinellaceae bacterium]
MTDEQIMMQVKEGGIRQLALLFERYQNPVYRYFLQTVQDQSLSEDLTQNVFERIIKYRNSFREESVFKSWIFSIARNVRYDHYRGLRITDDLGSVSEDEADHSPEDLMVQIEDSNKLHRALNHLDPEYREVLMLTRFEELKYKEVAVMLNCTEGTVKSKVHRAIQKLKHLYLKEEAYENLG